MKSEAEFTSAMPVALSGDGTALGAAMPGNCRGEDEVVD